MSYGQTTIWLPKVDRTATELTYTFSVKAPDYLADWILNAPNPGSGGLVQKTIDGKGYTLVKRFVAWDTGGSSPAKTGQMRFDTKLQDVNGDWKFEPKLKDDPAVIQALNSVAIPSDGPWKFGTLLALKWEGSTPPSVKFTEKIPELDQAKARMVEIARTTGAGKFYPQVKIPANLEGYRAAMLEIVNLGRRDPDYRAKNTYAANLRDDIVQTAPNQRQRVYRHHATAPLFNDVELDEKMNDLAQIQAEWAASRNYMGHDGPPNYNNIRMVNFGDRVQHFTPGYISAGEAGGWDTAPESWMQSETHYRPWFNIGHDVDFVGFGAAIGSDGKLRAFGVAASTRPHTAKAISKSYVFDLPLASGMVLEREKKYPSNDGRTYLFWQKEGNLGVFMDRSKEPIKENDHMLWSLATSDHKVNPWQIASIRVSAAANLEAIDNDGKTLWTSATQKPKLDKNGLSQEPIVSIPAVANTAVTQKKAEVSSQPANGATGSFPGFRSVAVVLNAGEKLTAQQALVSPNGNYILCSAGNDGNFCVYTVVDRKPQRFIWGSFQQAEYALGSDYFLELGIDGNLCVRDKDGVFKWGSYQAKPYDLNPGYKLVLTDAGKLNISDPSGKVVWTN